MKRGLKMSVSYKKLWHILLDRDMKKKDLEEMAGISHYMMKKMSRDESVGANVLGAISNSLGCSVDDIMEYIPDNEMDGGKTKDEC